MTRVIHSHTLPGTSRAARDFVPDYIDSFQTRPKKPDTVDRTAERLFESPAWTEALMRLRNALMRPFGLKTDGSPAGAKSGPYAPGDRLSYFDVVGRTDDEIVLGIDDRHLDLRISVLLDNGDVHLSTLVRFHNGWGRLYLAAILPFHRIIVGSSVRRLHRNR